MKRIKNYLLLIAAVLLLAGCSGKKAKEVTADPAELAKNLAEQAVTSDKLTSIAENMFESTYFVRSDSIVSGAAYASSGATACEAVVFKCTDEKAAAEAKTRFENRVSDQKERCASYNPEEVTKLDAAIIKTSGSYAVLCVCDDTAKAESILKEAGF